MLFAKTHKYLFTLIICYFHYRSPTNFIKGNFIKDNLYQFIRTEKLGHAKPATGGPVASSENQKEHFLYLRGCHRLSYLR